MDPELREAVDAFFDSWKTRVIERLEMGEERYKGKWREMTPDEVTRELMDEVYDMIAYAIFLRHKTESPTLVRERPEPDMEARPL